MLLHVRRKKQQREYCAKAETHKSITTAKKGTLWRAECGEEKESTLEYLPRTVIGSKKEKGRKKEKVVALPSLDITFAGDREDTSLRRIPCRGGRCLDGLRERQCTKRCWSSSA